MNLKRTLLDDVLQVYYSFDCPPQANSMCYPCCFCKNKEICYKIEDIINSLEKFY